MDKEMARLFLIFLKEKKGLAYDGPLVREFVEFSGYSPSEIWKLFDEINDNKCAETDSYIADSDHGGGIGHA